MVFLTSLNIVDTGYLDVNTRTGQLAVGYRVNDGVALQLKGVELEMSSSSALDKAATPGFSVSDIKHHEKRALVTINPTTFSLKLMFNRDDTSTTNAWGINDMALLKEVFELPHTAGFKALYYPVDRTAVNTGGNSTNKRDNQMIHQMGTYDSTESQGDLNLTLWTGIATAASKTLTSVHYVPVRFDNCSMVQTSDNKMVVTLSGVVTG